MKTTSCLTVFAIIAACCTAGLSAPWSDNITWSGPQGGVRIGARYVPNFGPATNGLVILYYTWDTNYSRNFVKPRKLTEFLKLSMARSGTGEAVKFTQRGRQFGTDVNRRISKRAAVSQELSATLAEPEQLASFQIDDCFVIDQTGDYTLEITPRLLRKPGGEADNLVQFSPIKMSLHLKIAR